MSNKSKGELMRALNFEVVAQNYESHPRFRFDEASWSCNPLLIKKFEKYYGIDRSKVGRLSFNRCVKVVNQLFHELQDQTQTEEELLFLLELKNYILQFLQEEYAFRKRINRRRSSEDFNRLEEDAYYFETLSKESISEILKIGAELLEGFKHNAKLGKLKRSDLSENSGKSISQICKILDHEFEKNKTFSRISDYVGIKYNRTGASLELSVAGSTWWQDTVNDSQSPKTVYAHLDESVYLPKAIVYLSNVTDSNGPTTLYPSKYDELTVPILADIFGRVIGKVGSADDSKLKKYYDKPYHQSSGSRTFRQHFMKLPRALRMNSHFGWDVIPGSELEKNLAVSEIPMLGGPGKTIVFDGSRLLHRGGLILDGERLVLQVVFYPQLKFSVKLKQKLNSIIRF
jgi:hypothetical protein